MDKSSTLLKQFASKKSQFFELLDGAEAKVRFLSAEEVPNNFDGGKTRCIRYHLEVDGSEQLWDRTSRSLAQQMTRITEGSDIVIKRTGQKSKTKYIIRKVD